MIPRRHPTTLYKRYRDSLGKGGSPLSFEKFYGFVKKYNDRDAIRKIAKSAGIGINAARTIIRIVELRSKSEIERIRKESIGRTNSLENLFEGRVYDAVVGGLRNPNLTALQVAEIAGVDKATVRKVNEKEKIRATLRGHGLRIANARRYGEKREAIRNLLSQKTVDGDFLYDAGQVAKMTGSNPRTVGEISKQARTAKEREYRRRQYYPKVASRRNTFVRRALKSTLVPMTKIARRAIEREKKFGGQTTVRTMLNDVKRSSAKLKKAGLLDRKKIRFKGGKFYSNKALKALWKNPRPVSQIDFLETAKNLGMPIYFVRRAYFENMPLFAKKLFETTNLGLSHIAEITNLPEEQLMQIKRKVNGRK